MPSDGQDNAQALAGIIKRIKKTHMLERKGPTLSKFGHAIH